jgi:hypothetical protein
VEAVAREAHEARLLAERTLYLANRMPMLVEWEATLVFQRIAGSPEAIAALTDLRAYRKVLESLARDISALPDKVSDERRSLLGDVAQLIARERAETLRATGEFVRSEREALFASLSKEASAYGPIMEQLAVTAAATREAIAGLERLQASSAARGGDGVDAKDVREITERLATAAVSTNEVVAGLNALLSSELRGLDSIDAMLASQLRRIFLYAVALVLLLGVVLYTVLRASRSR